MAWRILLMREAGNEGVYRALDIDERRNLQIHRVNGRLQRMELC